MKETISRAYGYIRAMNLEGNLFFYSSDFNETHTNIKEQHTKATMKTTGLLTLLFTSMAATAIASPNALPMGVEVVEIDGKTTVREVVSELLKHPLFSLDLMKAHHTHSLTHSLAVALTNDAASVLARADLAQLVTAAATLRTPHVSIPSKFLKYLYAKALTDSSKVYCTWCGDKCGSRCVRQGQTCQQTCV